MGALKFLPQKMATSYTVSMTTRAFNPEMPRRQSPVLPLLLVALGIAVPALAADPAAEPPDTTSVIEQANQWRSEHRLIDLHEHIDFTPEHLAHAVKIMDAAGIGIAVNLGTGTTTRAQGGKPSDFERNKALADELHPGRIVHYMLLDYHGWDDEDFSQRAVQQIDEGHRLGAAGLKEFKRLGLYLRDGKNKLIKIDDPKLDPVWERCGQLHMPVSIHVADPKAFWEPFNDRNERWMELKDHRGWWFGDPARFPPRMELVEALSRVVARHPRTTFVCVHFANNAEDLDWVDQALSKYPNMMADLAARIPEIGRHDPQAVRKLFIKHQDRILFGTDFQVYDRLTLGSGGNGPPPSDDDALTFFSKHWRWLETRDRDWPHMTPIQGDWTISSIGLPAPVLRKIYFDNARKLLAPSLPLPRLKASRIEKDFDPDGDLTKAAWQNVAIAHIDCGLRNACARPELSTTVRCLWSAEYLYLAYTCPYTRLTVFDPPSRDNKRAGLWDRDVVEAFIGADVQSPRHYGEFELAPTNERLDLAVNLPEKDFAWNSKFTSATKVDEARHIWTAEMRIPLSSLSESRPKVGTRWRLNLFRADRANNAFLAWNPTLTETAHTPERFGILEFTD
ncbi:MAG: Amidohydrolase [Phycisphaerales bacterium]|nr:Amidohydrolase [Phycisphaerales bacterium]